AGHRRRVALAEADADGDAEPYLVALFCAGARADGDLRLDGAALGDGAVPARGGALPRGRAHRPGAVGAPPAPRQGNLTDAETGVVLLRALARAALARRGARPEPCPARAPGRGGAGVRAGAGGAPGAALHEAATGEPGVAPAAALGAGGGAGARGGAGPIADDFRGAPVRAVPRAGSA